MIQIDTGEVVARTADTIPELEKRWLWNGYIPTRAVTLLEGDPGLGKSTVLCDLAARVSRGGPMPPEELDRYEEYSEPGNVLILSAEDDAETTIVPRLRAAAAALENIHLLEWLRTPTWDRSLILPFDVKAIRQYALTLGKPVKLLIVDPIVAYLHGETDTFKDSDVRAALRPIQELATFLECAVVLCRHLNKSSRGHSDIYAGGGSIGFTAAARSVIGTQKRKDWDTTRLVDFKQIKSNWGPLSEPLIFKIENPPIDESSGPPDEEEYDNYDGGLAYHQDYEIARNEARHYEYLYELFRPVTWLTDPQVSQAPQETSEGHGARVDLSPRRREAQVFLENLLPPQSSKPAVEVEAAFKATGIAERYLHEAKTALGIRSERRGDKWYWIRRAE